MELLNYPPQLIKSFRAFWPSYSSYYEDDEADVAEDVSSPISALPSEVEIYSKHKDSPGDTIHEVVEDILREVGYRPSPYCQLDHCGQLQTAAQYFLRNLTRLVSHVVQHPHYHVTFHRELLPLPDGGTIAIDWARSDAPDTPPLSPSAPIVMLFHGLVGDSQSEYLFHFSRRLLREGYRVGVMIARGCGGLALTSPVTFTGRRSGDIHLCIQRVRRDFPGGKLFWMSFSLGAASSLTYLEDYDEEREVTAALCVCPPWSLEREETEGFDVWSALMTLPIKAYMLKHYQVLRQLHGRFAHLTPRSVLSVKDIAAFDRSFFPIYGGTGEREGGGEGEGGEIRGVRVASFSEEREKERGKGRRERVWSRAEEHWREAVSPEEVCAASLLKLAAYLSQFIEPQREAEGEGAEEGGDVSPPSSAPSLSLQYASLSEYYRDASPVHEAHRIATPCLCISARDDPIVSHHHCPLLPSQLGPGLVVVKTPYGGHLAFPEGLLPLMDAWTDRVALSFFRRFL